MKEEKKKFKIKKKYLLGVSLVVGVIIFFLLFSSARAALIDTIFSGGAESDAINITSNHLGNDSTYFEISRFVTIQNASINVSGFSLDEFDYTRIFYSVRSQTTSPATVDNNGTHIFLIDRTDNDIDIYSINGIYENSLALTTSAEHGISQNGTFIWIAGASISTNTSKYLMDGTFIGYTYNGTYSTGIDNNGTHMFIDEAVGNYIEIWLLNGTYTGDKTFYGGTIGTTSDLTTNGTFIWISSFTTDSVFKFNMDGSYTGEEYSVDVETEQVIGITNDDDYFYVVDNAGGSSNDRIYLYSLGSNYPVNISIDVEDDGYIEFYFDGELNISNSPQLFNYTNFTTSLQNYINNTCTIDTCQIPINISSDTAGIVQLDDIEIYTTPSRRASDSFPSENVLETHYGNFNTTILFEDGENPVVYLNYSGTYYGATQIEKNNNNATYRVLLSIPLVSDPSNETRLFHWNITDSDITYTTNYQNHTAYRINVTNCTDPAVTPTLNFTVYDEIGGNLITSDLDSVWTFWSSEGDGSLSRSYNNGMDGRNNFSFCLYPSWANLTTTTTVSYSATGYEPREYNLNNYNIDNVSENINLYLLSTGNATTFKLTVRNNAYLYYPNVVVRTLKYQPSTDSFITVESCTTDVDATCLTHLILEDVDYRFMVLRPNGTILHTSGNFRAYCPESNIFSQCLFTVLMPPDLTVGNYVWDEVEGLSYAVTFDNVTKISSLTYSFNAGTVEYIRFLVSQDVTTICDVNSTAIAGVLNCDLTGYNGTVKEQVFLSRSPELAIYTFYLDLSEVWQTFGDAGLFFLILIMITIATASVVTGNPMAAIILVVAALGVAVVTGIGGIGIAPFILIAVAGAFIIFKLRQ